MVTIAVLMVTINYKMLILNKQLKKLNFIKLNCNNNKVKKQYNCVLVVIKLAV